MHKRSNRGIPASKRPNRNIRNHYQPPILLHCHPISPLLRDSQITIRWYKYKASVITRWWGSVVQPKCKIRAHIAQLASLEDNRVSDGVNQWMTAQESKAVFKLTRLVEHQQVSDGLISDLWLRSYWWFARRLHAWIQNHYLLFI